MKNHYYILLLNALMISVVHGQGFTEVIPSPFEDVTDGNSVLIDIDNDGDLDAIITGNSYNSPEINIAIIYLNDGSGNFTEVTPSPFEGVRLSGMDVADVDGDGDIDVLIAGRNSSGAQVTGLYLNDGTGQFTLAPSMFDGMDLGTVDFADFNGDGSPDVLITGDNGNINGIAKIYFNDGSGNFTEQTGTPLIGVEYSSVIVLDVNGDTYLDIIISGDPGIPDYSTNVYINDGTGQFTLQSTILEAVNRGALAYADVDGDGDLDVAIAGRTGYNTGDKVAKLYLNDGAGNFTEEMSFTGVDFSSVAFYDMNCDGYKDLIIQGLVSHHNRSLELYVNDGNGSFSLFTSHCLEPISHGSISFGDVDGDSDNDLLITGTSTGAGIMGPFNKRITRLYKGQCTVMECGFEVELSLTSDTICQGDCTAIEAIVSGGQPPYTITWNNGLSDGAGPYNICPTTTTTYEVMVTDANGDVTDATITVYVGTPDSTYQLHTVCAGNSISLYGKTYTSSGVYPETFTNIYGCDSVEYNEVVVLPSETSLNVTSTNLTDCSLSDGTIVFTGLLRDSVYSISYDNSGVVGPNNYTANSFGEITISGLGEGSYTDFTIAIGGCSIVLTDQIMIASPNNPTVFAGNDQVVCDGESIVLSASPAVGETVNWNNGVTNGVAFEPPVGKTVYTVTLTNASGCTATDDVEVVVEPLPVVDAGDDIITCVGDGVTLNINGKDTYTWSEGISNGVSFIPPVGTTNYTVTATGSNGCTASDNVNVIAYTSPEVTIFTNDSTGCLPFSVEFSSGATNPDDQCLWDLGDGTILSGCGTISHIYESPGCYDVQLTRTLLTTSCSSAIVKEDLICVGEPPVAFFNYHPLTPSEHSPLVSFINESIDAESYLWLFDDSIISNEANPNYTFPMVSGDYTVQLIAESSFGCADTFGLDIYLDEALLYYVPNAFTPDANGYNDYFLPIMTSGFDPSDYKLTIFNRWGEVVFESYDPYKGWDGSYNNSIVPDGTYIWTIEFRDNNLNDRIRDRGHLNIIK